VLPIEDMAGFLSHLRMCPACLAHSMRLRVSARALELLQDYAHHNQTFARAKLDNKQEKNDCKTLFIASTDCFDWCPMQSSLWARCPMQSSLWARLVCSYRVILTSGFVFPLSNL